MLPSCYEVTSTIRSYEKVRKGQLGKRAKGMLIKHNLKDRDSKLTFKADAQVRRWDDTKRDNVGPTSHRMWQRIRTASVWILGLATIRVLRRFALCLLALLYSCPDLPASIFLQPLESVSEDFAPAACPHHSNLCPNLCPNISSEKIVTPAACLLVESGAMVVIHHLQV